MTPYTTEDLERDLRHALEVGDPEEIGRIAREIDQWEKSATSVAPHAAALWYAEQNLRVFPLQPGSKVPFKGSRGCHDATSDLEAVNAWWGATPDANIGLATGGLVDVVDIDGELGQRSRARNTAMFDSLHVIGKVLTPRPGGMHLYVPATGKGNKAGLLGGIDYRGVGGYVVAPPSRTDVGSYRWLRPLDVAQLGGVA